MANRGQWRGAEIFMEGGGNLHRGGRKSLKRGAEILEERGGNQTEVVGRSTLYWAANELGLGHVMSCHVIDQQYASALVKHYHRVAMYYH